MIRFFLYISVYIFLVSGSVKAEDQRFFETLYDVPVMQGLKEVPEMGVSFDKPNGRIAEAGAISENLASEAIMRFYQLSLVQMGWQLGQVTENKAIYRREDEKLSVSIEKIEGSVIVRFTLEPVEA